MYTLGDLCQTCPWPMLVLGPEGRIEAVSAALAPLAPQAVAGRQVADVVPEWLSAAHYDLVTSIAGPVVDSPVPLTGDISGHAVAAHSIKISDDEYAWWLVESPDERLRFAEHSLAEERARAEFLARASTDLMSSMNVDRCHEIVLDLVVPALASAAAVVSRVPGRRFEVVRLVEGGTVRREVVDADPSGVPGLAEVLQNFPPIPAQWLDPGDLPDWVSGGRSPASAYVVGLPAPGGADHALVLFRDRPRLPFDDGEQAVARAFGARAGAALAHARAYTEQALTTKTLMRELLPPPLQRVHGVEFAGGYRASEDFEVVGGDFYDVHAGESPEDETLVVLGDVCGKGLDAAVLTGRIRNTLLALAPLSADHAHILDLLNKAMLTTSKTRFATMVLASVARRRGVVTLRLTSAGHPPPLIVRNDGRVEEVDTHGTFIGALPTIRLNSQNAVLAPGETCLLYTDGVTEARGGPVGRELFGEARLAEALVDCAGLPAQAIVERVLTLVSDWVGRREHDDIAIVAITAPRRGHLSAVSDAAAEPQLA